ARWRRLRRTVETVHSEGEVRGWRQALRTEGQMEGSELICEEARHVLQGHVLGRSRSYVRLFEFLVARSLEGRVPKEIEIAMEVFEKGADFDPAQDSIVRVYAYNLRQKLDRYYSTDGSARSHRLWVARGEYRIVLTTPSASEAASLNANSESEAPPVESEPVRRRSLLPAVLICAALLGVAIGFVGRRLIDEQSPSEPPGLASSVLWAPFFDD